MRFIRKKSKKKENPKIIIHSTTPKKTQFRSRMELYKPKTFVADTTFTWEEALRESAMKAVGCEELLVQDPDTTVPPDGKNKLRRDEARVFPLFPLEDWGMVRDHVLEQPSAIEAANVTVLLPEADVGTNTGPEAAEGFSLPPDLSEISLGGPVADAIDIFSSSNSIGPIEIKISCIIDWNTKELFRFCQA